MRALALTDHGNLYGAIDFYSYAKSAGIKPIIGVETYVSPRGMADKSGSQDRNYFHLVLLAKNRDGYQNLLKLVTRAPAWRATTTSRASTARCWPSTPAG